MVKRSRLASIATALAALGSPAVLGYVGAPDPGFGSGGRAFVNFASSEQFDEAHAVAIQPDGRIVSAGRAYLGIPPQPLAIARHLPGGTLDSSFSGDGKLTDFVATASFTTVAQAFGVAIQSDGRIVVAGSWFLAPFNTGDAGTLDLVVARYTATGAEDAKARVSLDGHSEARALALMADGRIVACGRSHVPYTLNRGEGPKRFALARFNTDLSLDTSFNQTGKVVTPLGSRDAECLAVALQADGRILAAGQARNAGKGVIAVARYTVAGALEAAVLMDLGGSEQAARAMLVQGDGKILLGGHSDASSAVLRLTEPGTPDPSFASAGRFLFPGRPIVSLALQPDGRILALADDFQVWRLTPEGAPDPAFGVGGRVVVPMPAGAVAKAIALQPDGRIVVAGSATGPGGSMDFVVARIDPSATMPDPVPSTATVSFGGQSMNTTSLAQLFELSTGPAGSVTVTRMSATPPFAVASQDCGTMGPSTRCLVALTFTPRSPGPQAGTLRVESTGSTFAMSLAGVGERSLVTHYYQSILGRAPDAGGKAFWEGEAVRVAGLGANVNEAWFAMAQQFYSSAEYATPARGNGGFVADLYRTFFNRLPDNDGLAFWAGNLDQGMPRGVALAAFMFSAEFRNFAQSIFGNTAARAEVDMVMDFYRGLLARTPDDAGFGFWLARLRSAQCRGADIVAVVAEEISSAFARSTEYAARSRSNADYVGDLYNAFLRRGGDLPGVQYWIGRLDAGAMTREEVRVQFRNSAEFQARVNAVVQQGCLQ